MGRDAAGAKMDLARGKKGVAKVHAACGGWPPTGTEQALLRTVNAFLPKPHHAEGEGWRRETDCPGWISGMTEMLLMLLPEVRERSIRMSL